MAILSDRREAGRFGRCGFTLVELLVVISIICLLVSLSLPALTQAQRQAEQVHCLANQHQLMLAWLMFADEHDDKLCNPQSWDSDLESYTKSKELLVCKTDDDGTQRNSYAISNLMGGKERDGVVPFARLHRISQAGNKMVFVDRERQGSDCFWPVLWNAEKWVWRPWSWPPGLQGMTSRHHNGCNAAFADGHVESIRWKDDRTRKLIKGTMADPNEASVGNADLNYLVEVLTVKRTAHVEEGD